jgi:flagellin-specific chaperone FliS
MTSTEFGRVDSENNVYVIEPNGERKVGQVPNVSQEDALAYFTKKFEALEGSVRLLEQRIAKKADAESISKTAAKLTVDLVEAAAVGNLQSLRERVLVLAPKIQELLNLKKEESKEDIAKALAAREEIVAKVEVLANGDLSKVMWKQVSTNLTELFEAWQAAQKSGPRVPKSEADALWKRFQNSRNKLESAKRAFFAEAGNKAKAAKASKESIVKKAEELAAKGSDSVVEYRKLLDEWKTAGRTKADDALWVRFKAAGDSIYAAKSEQVAVISASQSEALAAKLALLEEAKAIDPSKDLAKAKQLLLNIQDRWEKAGRVSRNDLAKTEDKLKAIEAAVRNAERDHWKATDPAAKARKDDVTIKLEEAIAKLESDLAKTTDKKKIAELTEALAARKSWLEVVTAAAK